MKLLVKLFFLAFFLFCAFTAGRAYQAPYSLNNGYSICVHDVDELLKREEYSIYFKEKGEVIRLVHPIAEY